MGWVIEEPTLYVFGRVSPSPVYRVMLGLATLPRKYTLYAYSQLQALDVEDKYEQINRDLVQSAARTVYSGEGAPVMLMAIAGKSFAEHSSINNDFISVRSPLIEEDDGKRLCITGGRSRPVQTLSDKELDELAMNLRSRQGLVRVQLEDWARADMLPDVRSQGGPTLWG